MGTTGEDHEPETMFDVEPMSWEETAKSLMREKVERLAQGEDHEAGETAAAKALYPILHAVSRGDSPELLLGHAVRVTLNAYLARVSPCRDARGDEEQA